MSRINLDWPKELFLPVLNMGKIRNKNGHFNQIIWDYLRSFHLPQVWLSLSKEAVEAKSPGFLKDICQEVLTD